MASGQPVWIADIASDLSFPHLLPDGRHVRMRGAFGFTVLLGTETLVVLEFRSREIKEADRESLKMMAAVGN